MGFRLRLHRGLRNQIEVGYAFKVLPIVGNQRQVVPNSAGGNPQVVALSDAISSRLCFQSCSEPAICFADFDVVRNDDSRFEALLKSGDRFGIPAAFGRAVIKFADGDEGYRNCLSVDMLLVRLASPISSAQ